MPQAVVSVHSVIASVCAKLDPMPAPLVRSGLLVGIALMPARSRLRHGEGRSI